MLDAQEVAVAPVEAQGPRLDGDESDEPTPEPAEAITAPSVHSARSTAEESQDGSGEVAREPAERQQSGEAGAESPQRSVRHGGSPSRVDDLLRRREDFERKMEAKRAEKARSELKAVTGTPKINAKSRAMAARRTQGSAIHERAASALAAKDAKLEEMREALRRKEEGEVKRQPAINKTSQRMTRSRNAADMAAWQREREARLAEQRRMREQEQRSATQPRRYTNRTSERIVQRMRAREALGQEQAVEEDAGSRLYRAAIESERKRQDRARQAAEEHCHTPKVAPHSASLPRQGDVSERLYGLAQKRALKSAIRRQAREEEERVDAESGQPLFQPRVNPTSAAIARFAEDTRGAAGPVEERLAARAAEYEERRARRAQRVEAETRRQARVPLSKRSEALGGGTGSARERLTRPIGTVRASTMATVQAPSFRPATSASRGGSGAASPARRQERPRPGTAGSSAHGAQRRGSGRREGRPYEKGGREAGSGRSHSIARGQLRGREGARTREGSAHHARRSASVGASSRKAPAPAARASARQNLTEAFEAGMDRDGDGEEDEEERGWDGDGGADKPPHSPVEALLSSSADPESLAEALVAAERARMSSKRRHREEEEEEAPASSAGVRRSEPRVPETRFADRSEEGGAEEAPAPRGRRSRPDADERGGGVPKPSGHGSPPPRNRSAGAARLFTAGREWQERRERALEAARREKEVKEANECTFRPNARGRPQRPQRRPPPRPKASGGAPSSDAAANVTPRHAAATGAREVLERARSRREGERGSAVRSAEPAAVAPSHVVDPGDTAVASDPGQWSEHVTEDGYLYYHNDLTGKVQWTRPQGVASQYA